MPFYQNKGLTPAKRHTIFKYNNKLCYEELVSREGFSSMYTNLYHLHMPTCVKRLDNYSKINMESVKNTHQPHHIKTFDIIKNDDAIKSRVPLFFNLDIIINIANVSKNMDYFYRNGHFDELMYVQNGKGNTLDKINSLSRLGFFILFVFKALFPLSNISW